MEANAQDYVQAKEARMTLRQAAFLVASDEVAKAKDFYWLVYCNPKLPRSSLKKARLAVHAAEMRAARILSTNVGVLPAVFRAEIMHRMRQHEAG